ncbi:hypothetical protein RhiirA4_462993 [Rhizophagus irregularis]|uniref:BTB domain-containing protein n=1 Tax=Rhizophagus irregularis TaxID=588596 RepID=A0A2I1GM14_9GLOM|nr:hypothetical protein RhiirA4_462993 [Rhizophagus irregularis]
MKLLENDEDCNVIIIYVGENENVKEVQTNSCILRIKSQYFRIAFSMKRRMENLLKLFYTVKIDSEKLQELDKAFITLNSNLSHPYSRCAQEFHYLFKYRPTLSSVSSPCGVFLALNRTSFRAINEVLATSANSIVRIQFCVNKIKVTNMLRVKDKKYVYAYPKDEEGLGKALELSLHKYDTGGAWIIPPKRKNFNNFISTETAQNNIPMGQVQKFQTN